MKISSIISSFNPYLDKNGIINGIIRVGGRLGESNINSDCKEAPPAVG